MNPQDPFPGHGAEDVLDAWEAVIRLNPDMYSAVRRQTLPGMVIEPKPPNRWQAFRARPLLHQLLALVWLYVFLAVFFFGTLILLGIWDAITG